MEQRAHRPSDDRDDVDGGAEASTPGGRRSGGPDAGTLTASPTGPRARDGSAALDEVRRREYPDPGPGIFLNTASWGLVPRSSAEASADLSLRRNRTLGFREEEIGAALGRCRAAAATLVGASPESIAVSANTSYGINLAAHHLRQSRDPGVVVVPEGEFPANVLPYRGLERDGFEVRVVSFDPGTLLDEERLIEALDEPDVVALSISAVQFASGVRADLEALGRACREREILFVVDAIQALGATALDVEAVGADILACGGQKWLCGPWGSGFTYLHPEIQERLEPPMVSWLGTRDGADFDDMLHYRMEWRDDARTFEMATPGVQDYLGLGRSIEVLTEIGLPAIEVHLDGLQEIVRSWAETNRSATVVTPSEPHRRAGIIALEVPDPTGLCTALADDDIVCSAREGWLRLAPHVYTTEEQMERVVQRLDALLG